MLCYSNIDDIFTKYFYKIENKLYICDMLSAPPPTLQVWKETFRFHSWYRMYFFARTVDAINLNS
jgi:hypothetical protein